MAKHSPSRIMIQAPHKLYSIVCLSQVFALFCCQSEDPEPEPEPEPAILDPCKKSNDYLKATIKATEIGEYAFFAGACDGYASRKSTNNGALVIYCHVQFDRNAPFQGTIDDYFEISIGNASSKGMYAFGVDSATGTSTICKYRRAVAGWDLYSYSTSPEGSGSTSPQGSGTITIDSISSSFIRGTFNAVLFSSQDSLAQATITNGSFAQGIE
jgi:hypothetical protein